MRRLNWTKYWGMGVLMLGLAQGLSLAWAQTNGTSANTNVVRGLPDFTELVERAGPAVVNIRTTERARQGNVAAPFPGMPELDENDPFYDFFRRFFPPGFQRPQPQTPQQERRRNSEPGQEVPRGVGSGFIISADGFIMTNAHVIEGADQVYVTLTDKREFKAKVMGTDPRTDVAVVKIEATALPRVVIGDVNELKVGQWVVAIGSPFGLDNSVTAGIVSAKQRDTGEFLPFIQTDVAVNPGNSGGPLLNMKGEVVGINSQIYSRTGGFMGISFAIPIDEAMRVADQLRASGKVTRGRIGVGIAEVSKDVAESLGVKPVGALVRSVEKDSPAEKAGIEAGDILLKWENKAIEKSTDLPRLVANTRPGTRATLQLWRKGQLREAAVTVAEIPAEKTASAVRNNEKPGNAEPNALGLAASDLSAEKKTELRIKNGVHIELAEGAAARAGIRPGDIVLSINNQDVNSARQFNDLVAKLDKNKAAVLLVRRGDVASFVPVKPAQ